MTFWIAWCPNCTVTKKTLKPDTDWMSPSLLSKLKRFFEVQSTKLSDLGSDDYSQPKDRDEVHFYALFEVFRGNTDFMTGVINTLGSSDSRIHNFLLSKIKQDVAPFLQHVKSLLHPDSPFLIPSLKFCSLFAADLSGDIKDAVRSIPTDQLDQRTQHLLNKLVPQLMPSSD